MSLAMVLWFIFSIVFVIEFVKLLERVEKHEQNRGLNRMILYDIFYYSEGSEE